VWSRDYTASVQVALYVERTYWEFSYTIEEPIVATTFRMDAELRSDDITDTLCQMFAIGHGIHLTEIRSWMPARRQPRRGGRACQRRQATPFQILCEELPVVLAALSVRT
jgi:hypothetical protein